MSVSRLSPLYIVLQKIGLYQDAKQYTCFTEHNVCREVFVSYIFTLGKFLELHLFLHYSIWVKSRLLFLGQAFLVGLCLQYNNPTRITQTRIYWTSNFTSIDSFINVVCCFDATNCFTHKL